MYPKILEVKPEKNYLLYLIFDKNEVRILDMKPYLDFGIFKELENEDLFNTVKISFDSVEWANHADLDPEFLYRKSVPAKKSRKFSKSSVHH